MSNGGLLERLSELLRTDRVASVRAAIPVEPLAVGWATVELDRAVAEVGTALQLPAARFADAAGSVILGARCLVASGVLPGGVALILLEPNTEGRLAGTLARHDEGPAAVWLSARNLADAVAGLATAGFAVSPAQAGPCGAEGLIDGPRYGPHLLLVEGPGTIPA